MTITFTQTPEKALFGGAIGRNVAAHNPILFKVQRKDLTSGVTLADDGSGNLLVTVPHDDFYNALNADFLKGTGYIYLKTTGGFYTGTWLVIDYNPSLVTFTLDVPYTSADTIVFLNYSSSVKNFYLQTSVVVGVVPVSLVMTNTPDTTGLATINISSRVSKLLSMANPAVYQYDDLKDTNDSNVVHIVTTGFYYLGGVPTVTDPITSNDFYFFNTAKQIGDTYGGNMGDFTPVEDVSVVPLARFLTEFASPTYFEGYPFDLAFIYDQFLAGTIKMNHAPINVNGTSAGSPVNVVTYDTALKGYLVRSSEFFAAYDPSFDRLNVKITSDTPSAIDLTETLPVKVRLPCCNPVYLCWHNNLGGKSYWLFSHNQTKKLQVDSEISFEQFVEDLAAAQGNISTLSKRSTPQMILGSDNLTTDEVDGIQSLFESPCVQVLTNAATWYADGGPAWLTVRPSMGNFLLRETKGERHSIELLINFPERNLTKQ